MQTKLVVSIIIGIIISSGFASVYAVMYDCLHPPLWIKAPVKSDIGYCFGLFVNGMLPTYSRQLEYDSLCFTQFWTETSAKPNQLYVQSAILEQLKEKHGLDFSPDDITFYDTDSEFVVSITGDWNERSSVAIMVKEILENMDEITHVKDIAIACA